MRKILGTCLLVASLFYGEVNSEHFADTQAYSGKHGIVAVVDDEIITGIELEKRYKMLIVSNAAAAELSTNNPQSLKSQVLLALINEKILAQEAAKLGIVVTQQDLNTRISLIEQRQKIPSGNFIKLMEKEGLDRDVLLQEITGILIWEKFLSEVIVPKIDITESTLFEFIDQNYSNKVKIDVQLISANSKDSREQIQQLWHKNQSCSELVASKKDLERKGLYIKSIKGTLQKISDKSIRHAITYTKSNSRSYIFNKDNTANFIWVCDKKYDFSEIELNKIRHELRLKKVETLAEHYMENLKKKKHIEVHESS